MNLSTEPARIISLVTALLTALIGAAAAFGLDIDDTQRNAILAVVAPAVGVIVVLGEVIRSRVVSPASAGEAVVTAKQAEPASKNMPDIRVPYYRDAVVEKMPGITEQDQVNWRPRIESATP